MTLRRHGNIQPIIDDIPDSQDTNDEILRLLRVIIMHLELINDVIIEPDPDP